MDDNFPCKNCGHAYAEHLMSTRCQVCWNESGYDARHICIRFVGDNLAYLEQQDDIDR